MKSILTDIYYGKNIPFEREYPKSDVYDKINSDIEAEKDLLMKHMNEDELKHFRNLEDLYTRSNTFDEADIFIRGFRLAVLIFLETLKED